MIELREEFILPIASFLARAWSGSKNVQVYLNSDMPYSNSTSILLPMPSKFSKNKETAYRLWRASLFHETQHIALGSFDYYNKLAILPSYITFTLSSEAKKVFINILEDYRINSKSVKTYKGMVKEFLFRNAIYFEQAPVPDNTPDGILETFRQLMLFGVTKNPNPPDFVLQAVKLAKEKIDNEVPAVEWVEEVWKLLGLPNSSLSEQHITCTFAQVAPLSQKLVKQAVENYVKQLIEKNPSLLDEKEKQEGQEQEGQEQGGQEGMGGQGGGQEGEQGNENKPDERKVGVEELAEHISENILMVPEEIKSEIKEIEKLEFQYEQVHASKGGEEMRVLVPRKMYNDYIHIYNEGLVNHVKQALRHIRRGWKEMKSDTGSFEVDDYIARRYPPFIDEERVGSKNMEVIILLDHSGSIGYYEEKYKEVVVALCEGLNYINAKFQVYAFSVPKRNGRPITSVWQIKALSEKWGVTSMMRLAQIAADGGTPLYEVYKILFPVVSNKSRDNCIFITFTDGEPDDVYNTKKIIAVYKKTCNMYAITYNPKLERCEDLVEYCRNLGYEKVAGITDISKFPQAVLSMIVENRRNEKLVL